MQDGTLLLGPIVFQDFEIPARVNWGGAQRLAIHRLPGGARVIDMLGRDDSEISWTGIFTGDDGAIRARLLDTLRVAGGPLLLTWDAFFYSVVIAWFEADYARSNWIPYRISCTILRDEAAAAVDAVVSLASSALGDLASAAGFDTTIDLTAATTAIGVAGATTVGTSAYATATAALAAASSQISSNVTQAEASLTVATDPGVAADVAGTLASLTNAQGYVQRVQANLANASS
jgi:hypothetical protein